MRHRIFITAVFAVMFFLPLIASAALESIKLPYEAGQRFVVVQGYDAPPTHINKDLFALDLSQAGCDAYGKPAIAASGGEVMLVQQTGYNGGYGTQILIVNDNRIVARYAHLIPGTILVGSGDTVIQGEPLGEIGNTGLVAGAACPSHPGTHIHFAMYSQQANGSFTPFLPEPISNYVGIQEGKWYLSDNTLARATIPGATVIIKKMLGLVLGESSSVPEVTGGVSASPASSPTPADPAAPIFSVTPQDVSSTQPMATTTATSTLTANTTFNTSTLMVDLAWSSPSSPSGTVVYNIFKVDPANASNTVQVGTTTNSIFSYPLSDVDFGTSPQFAIAIENVDASDASSALSTIQTIPISLPDWFINTAIQSVDNINSNGSWYSDNWYDLGAGFYGTIRSLTLEGFVDNSSYFASHLWLDEYLDPDYSQLNQTFTVSDNAPFTAGHQKITITGLNIPLQPNKYYRLRTYQDYQNRSVILAGTSATGTAMWDQFIYGIGIVRNQYAFYPYLSALMIPNYPPLMPPDPVASITMITFNASIATGPQLYFSWTTGTDPDTMPNLLTYQVNVSTSTASGSTVLDPTAWRPVGISLGAVAPVASGSSYTIGVRAVDDFGNTGTPTMASWSFPN